MLKREIEDLKDQIGELKKGMPAHSVDPARLQKLEELEERLEAKKSQLNLENQRRFGNS